MFAVLGLCAALLPCPLLARLGCCAVVCLALCLVALSLAAARWAVGQLLAPLIH